MPNEHGFDRLTVEGVPFLRCIWCGKGQPVYRLGEGTMKAHAKRHAKDRKEAAEEAQREKQTIEESERR